MASNVYSPALAAPIRARAIRSWRAVGIAAALACSSSAPTGSISPRSTGRAKAMALHSAPRSADPDTRSPFQTSASGLLEDIAQLNPWIIGAANGAMQQGSALPLAVMYIRIHGRRQPCQGCSPLTATLSWGVVAPEARKGHPQLLGQFARTPRSAPPATLPACHRAIARRSSSYRARMLAAAESRPAVANRPRPRPVPRPAAQNRAIGARFSCIPTSQSESTRRALVPPWRWTNARRLSRMRGRASIPAQFGVEFRRHRIHRDPQFVQPGLHQRVAPLLVQQHAVGVEEHVARPAPSDGAQNGAIPDSAAARRCRAAPPARSAAPDRQCAGNSPTTDDSSPRRAESDRR